MADRRYRLIVFDWDGTLVDSTAIIAEAIQSACRDVGHAAPDDRDARYVIGLGLADAIRHVAPGIAGADMRELSERYRHHFLLRESEIALFEGAPGLLQDLRLAGYRLAVATGKTRKGLDRALATTGLGPSFDATRCADEGRPKPHPDMLLHLMETLEVTPAETLMVGDTTHDIEMARSAGAESAAVSHGAHDAHALRAAGAGFVGTSLAAVQAWIGSRGQVST
jgi:phosphoglycolate phosphatase